MHVKYSPERELKDMARLQYVIAQHGVENTKEEISVAILDQQVLESIGCDNTRMLKAASRRNGQIIDVNNNSEKDGNNEDADRPIKVLFRKSMFHKAKCAEKVGMRDAL